MRKCKNSLTISVQRSKQSSFSNTLAKKKNCTEGNLENTINLIINAANDGFVGDSSRGGVNFQKVVALNLTNLFDKVVYGHKELDEESYIDNLSLHQRVEEMLRNPENGFAKAKRFLDLVNIVTVKHKTSLIEELEGNKEANITGDIERFKALEKNKSNQIRQLKAASLRGFSQQISGNRPI